jgi:hypothetical protein
VKVITLRNVPPAVSRVIRRKAAAERTSINKTVIRLLEASAAKGPPEQGKREEGRPPYHDLDGLAGCWTKEEAATFEALLQGQRVVDPKMWASFSGFATGGGAGARR